MLTRMTERDVQRNKPSVATILHQQENVSITASLTLQRIAEPHRSATKQANLDAVDRYQPVARLQSNLARRAVRFDVPNQVARFGSVSPDPQDPSSTHVIMIVTGQQSLI